MRRWARPSSSTRGCRSASARGSTSRAASMTGSACRCCSRRSRSRTWSRRSPAGATRGRLLLEEIGYGALGGVVAGLVTAAIVVYGGRRGSDRGRVAPGDPGRRSGARVRPRGRAPRVGFHRRVRGRRGVPTRARPRPGSARPAHRGGRRPPQRRDVRALRRRPARSGAVRAELADRPVCRDQSHRRADAARRDRHARHQARGPPRSRSSVGSGRAGWPRSCSP